MIYKQYLRHLLTLSARRAWYTAAHFAILELLPHAITSVLRQEKSKIDAVISFLCIRPSNKYAPRL